jgi:type IV secretion system protein TrbL
MAGAALRGMASAIGNAAHATGSAAKEKAIASPGTYAGSLLGLANAKLDQTRLSGRPTPPPPPPPINENK